MPIVKRSRSDIDRKRLLAALAARPEPGETAIAAHAREDRDAWAAAILDAAEGKAETPNVIALRG